MTSVTERPGSRTISDLRGVARLAIDATLGVTEIVEAMHRNIASLSPIIGASPTGGARGISGLVYASVRGITRIVGFGLDAALGQLNPVLALDISWPGRDAVLAAFNGVVGDHLVASENPLAIRMQLRQAGEPLALDRRSLAAQLEPAGSKLLVLVHGLCMNDLQWERNGHDHGARLAKDLGYVPLYLHYNSGRQVAANGREFADILERLHRAWPVPVSELIIFGHSMGGLVARSACHYARLADHDWLRHLRQLVFLGTPHQGAPLERAGSWVNAVLGISPYLAPFARIGDIRSAGIKDLSRGHITEEDLESRDQAGEFKRSMQLPAGVECFAIAATMETVDYGMPLAGDGLVPVTSALGLHDSAALTLPIPAERQAVIFASNHFDLLSSRRVYRQLEAWVSSV